MWVPDITKLAWAAGFWDGEGCASVFKRGKEPYHYAVLQMSQSDPFVLRRFQESVGGLGRIYGPYDRHRPNTKPEWAWRANSYEEAQAVIAMLWHFISPDKREQAKIVFGQRGKH